MGSNGTKTAASERVAPSLIESHDLTMSFDPLKPVLREITCNILAGEFVAILGQSGCGKSTFLRIVAGLMSHTSGSLTIANQRPNEARRTAQSVAFVFQDPNLLPWRSVADNIALPLELRGVPREERMPQINQVLSLIGLTADDAGKQPRSLSGGMRMRVSLARALVTKPDVLLLDEPFAALDDVLRQQLNEELSRIWIAHRWTGLFVTHNVAEAVFLAQRVFVMSKRPGTIVADVRVPFGYPREPALRATADFARLCGDLSFRLREAAQ